MSQRNRKILIGGAISLSVATGVAIVIAVILSSSKKSDKVKIFENNKTGETNLSNSLSFHISSWLLSPGTFLKKNYFVILVEFLHFSKLTSIISTKLEILHFKFIINF